MDSIKTQMRKLPQRIRDAQNYLDSLESDPHQEPDPVFLHTYLDHLLPWCNTPQVSKELVCTVARLFFAARQYQDAAMLLKRLRDPALNGLLVRCDFFNGYYVNPYDWVSRQEEIQQIICSSEHFNVDLEDLRQTLDYCFPAHLLQTLSGKNGQSGVMFLGNPDGIYSLFPLNYLVQHMPALQHFDLVVDSSDSESLTLSMDGMTMHSAEVQVRITRNKDFLPGTKMDLTLWHPMLPKILQKGGKSSSQILTDQLVHSFLSIGTVTFYIGNTSLAEKPFEASEKGDIVSLEDLYQWFYDRGMDPDIDLRKALRNRVYSFTREPVMVTRPRGDILRGETCMPELEEIYFLRNGKGMAAFQRYGVGYWFLIIPKTVCGDGFPAFRDALIQAVRDDEEDAVCFTGWAEGTRNWYLDFLSLSSTSTLDALQYYLDGLPGGKSVRISSFYWNSVPRTLDYTKETEKLLDLDLQDPSEPPKEQVSAKARANLEKAFRETRWEKTGTSPSWDIDVISPYDSSLELLEKLDKSISSSNKKDVPLDYSMIHSILRQVLPKDDAPGASDAYFEHLAQVLVNMERFRESAKWRARTRPSDERDAYLYTTDLGSSFPDAKYQWEIRRQSFWQRFAAVESDLAQGLDGGVNSKALSDFREQADAVFPSQDLTLVRDPSGKKNTLYTGLPGGILTLPAMLYFTSHYPANLGKRWNIAISGGSAPVETIDLIDNAIPVQEVWVSLIEQDGGISLELWHPLLLLTALADPNAARNAAMQPINSLLPLGTRLVYGKKYTVVRSKPEGAFPLPELPQKMRDLGYPLDIPLDTLLSRRRYSIRRQPKDTGRPRDDIIRGETCMPELERIYSRLYEEGQSILERHGIFALFLMIPNSLCNGDPAQYRQQLQRHLSLAERDKVFFTGWAEGEKYCYLDLISMHGRSLLNTLNEYALSNPGGKELRYSSFYWNSIPLSWETYTAVSQTFSTDRERFQSLVQAHLAQDFPVPDAKAAAALEASFHPEFKPEDFCTAKPAEAPAPAAQQPAFGKKKLSKAQRKAQNSKNNQNNQNNKSGKNNKKKR